MALLYFLDGPATANSSALNVLCRYAERWDRIGRIPVEPLEDPGTVPRLVTVDFVQARINRITTVPVHQQCSTSQPPGQLVLFVVDGADTIVGHSRSCPPAHTNRVH